jgi:hypothetical protein
MTQEAMKQALEFFESGNFVYPTKIATDLRQAIAELESQEPVAWADLQKEAQQIVKSKVLWEKFIDGTPLANDIACWMADFALQHTRPPQRTWQGLTDYEIGVCSTEAAMNRSEMVGGAVTFARAIEAKLKEKNT